MTELLLTSADYVLSLCLEVYKMVKVAKSNKAQCQQVGERVRTLEKMVRRIKQRPENASPDVKDALVDLAGSLKDATQLMAKVSKANALVGFLASSSNESKLQEISQKLNEDVQLLSMALQICYGDALRDGLKAIVDEHRTANRLEPVLRASRATDENGADPVDGSAGATAPDATSLVAKLLLASTIRDERKVPVPPSPPASFVPSWRPKTTPAAKLSATEAPVAASPVRMIPVRAAPKLPKSPKTNAPVPASLVSPQPAMPMSPLPMMSPVPRSTVSMTPMPMSPMSPMSPIPMMSPVPRSPVSTLPYPLMSPSPPVVFNPMPMLYQPPTNMMTSTVISYNRPPPQALDLGRLFAALSPQSHVISNSINRFNFF
ncbi:uncharacterized protein LOC127598412 [Hippocampus zosterae]|uniref:uncharacterized protein LOC127598412 n=1 Tax=Hippocampus zosterae TaxID=109293 RepID=UPI00223D3C11|nr:uncharacterized protein LOC127598412 [Hippocampus zosterae]